MSVAMGQLGLTYDEFLDLTPVQFSYLLETYEAERELKDFRVGIVASTIANCNRKKGAKAFKPIDFMPKYGQQTQSPDQMMLMAKTLNAAFGGKVVKKGK